MHRFLGILLMVLAAFPATSEEPPKAADEIAAKSPTTEDFSPEKATQAYLTALQEEGLGATTQFMHPEEMEKMKSFFIPLFELEEAEGDSEMRDLFFGAGSTLDDVRKASGAEHMQKLMEMVGAPIQAAGGLSFDKIEVLGAVPEGEIIHTVTRTTIGVGDATVTKMEVLSWRPYGDEWRLMLSGDMQGLVQQIAAQLGVPAQ